MHLGDRMPGSANTERTFMSVRSGYSAWRKNMGRPTKERVNSLAVSVIEFQRSSNMSVSSEGGRREGLELIVATV